MDAGQLHSQSYIIITKSSTISTYVKYHRDYIMYIINNPINKYVNTNVVT
jgi:hypothetical protein